MRRRRCRPTNVETVQRRAPRHSKKAFKIERTTRLWAGARETRTAERLHADDRSDDVAIHVDIAGLDPAHDPCDRLVDPGVQAEGQAVTGRIDLIDQPVEFLTPVA